MSCKIGMLFGDLKSNRAIANRTGVQDKVIWRWWSSHTPSFKQFYKTN